MNVEKWLNIRFFSPAGEGEGGGGAGDDTVAGGGGQDTVGGGSDTTTGSGGNDTVDAGGGGPRWFEADSIKGDTAEYLKRSGLTLDDPAEAAIKAAEMARNAQARLGHNPDDLFLKPKEGEVASWLKENRELLGIPENAEGYTIEKPKDFKGTWDKELADKLRGTAAEIGLSQDQAAAIAAMAAAHVGEEIQKVETDLQSAHSEVSDALKQDWGDQYTTKVGQAKQVVEALAQAAGMDAEATQNAVTAVAEKTGDANAIRMFSELAGLVGNDNALNITTGGNGAMTPAEARAEISKLKSPDGEYFKAVNAGDRAKMKELQPRLEQLAKIAAQ